MILKVKKVDLNEKKDSLFKLVTLKIVYALYFFKFIIN
jgi:hypothetical protein